MCHGCCCRLLTCILFCCSNFKWRLHIKESLRACFVFQTFWSHFQCCLIENNCRLIPSHTKPSVRRSNRNRMWIEPLRRLKFTAFLLISYSGCCLCLRIGLGASRKENGNFSLVSLVPAISLNLFPGLHPFLWNPSRSVSPPTIIYKFGFFGSNFHVNINTRITRSYFCAPTT